MALRDLDKHTEEPIERSYVLVSFIVGTAVVIALLYMLFGNPFVTRTAITTTSPVTTTAPPATTPAPTTK